MRKLHHINFQLNTAASRQEMAGGREYTVVPAMTMRGVQNGILYPADEIAMAINTFNRRPVVINHPYTAEGEPLAVTRAPEVPAIGAFFDGFVANDGLQGEVWFDNALASEQGDTGRQIVANAQNAVMMEVSWGVFLDMENLQGTFDGKPYEAVARNIEGDHLAILTNNIGACSIKDGCGTSRTAVNSGDGRTNGSAALTTTRQRATRYLVSQSFAANFSSSFREIANLLRAAVVHEGEWVWIADVFETVFVYETEMMDGDVSLWQRAWTLAADEKSVTVGDRVPVVKRHIYEPVTAVPVAMNSNQGGQGDGLLHRLARLLKSNGSNGQKEMVTMAGEGNPLTLEAVQTAISAMLDDKLTPIQADVTQLKANQEQAVTNAKAQLVNQLEGHVPYDRAFLEGQSVEQLRIIAQAHKQPNVNGYGGAAPYAPVGDDEFAEAPMPTGKSAAPATGGD